MDAEPTRTAHRGPGAPSGTGPETAAEAAIEGETPEDYGSEAPGEAPGEWRLLIPTEPLELDYIPDEVPGETIPLEEVRRATAEPLPEPQPAPEQETREASRSLCLRCFGGGQIVSPTPCPVCRGAREDWCEGISIPCPACHATGRVNVPCPQCDGTGWVKHEAPPAEEQPVREEETAPTATVPAQPAETNPAEPKGAAAESAQSGPEVSESPETLSAAAELPQEKPSPETNGTVRGPGFSASS